MFSYLCLVICVVIYVLTSFKFIFSVIFLSLLLAFSTWVSLWNPQTLLISIWIYCYLADWLRRCFSVKLLMNRVCQWILLLSAKTVDIHCHHIKWFLLLDNINLIYYLKTSVLNLWLSDRDMATNTNILYRML